MPLYNYDELVSKIQLYRFQIYEKYVKSQQNDNNIEVENHNSNNDNDELYEILLSQTLEVYETLSNYCPMTIFLWMQYGQIMYMYSKQISFEVGNENDTDPSIDTTTTTTTTNNMIQSYNMRIEIIELGLIEFPGSSILQLHYIEMLTSILIELIKDNDNKEMDVIYEHINKIHIAQQNAIEYVGLGSHYNEDYYIILLYKHQRNIYRLQYYMCLFNHDNNNINNNNHVDYCFDRTKYYMNMIFQSYINQSRVPMKIYNDDIINEIQNEFILLQKISQEKSIISKDMIDIIYNTIDINRRSISKLYSTRFITNDDNIMIQMKNDNIWFNDDSINNNNNIINNNYNGNIYVYIAWDDTILSLPTNENQNNNSIIPGMGYGSIQLANLFIGYARALYTYHIPKHSSLNNNDKKNKKENEYNTMTQINDNNSNDNEVKYMNQLSFCVYERGIVECPTIEIIWLSYIRSLCETIMLHNTTTNSSTLSHHNINDLCQKLQSVCHRAVRNCPYSILLVQQQLMSYYYLAEYNIIVFDPDQLLTCISNVYKNEFISIISLIDLYITAIRVTKRRILSLLCKWNGGIIKNMSNNNKEDLNHSKDNKNNKKITVGSDNTKILLQYDDSEQPLSDNDNKKNSKKNKNESLNTGHGSSSTILEEIIDLAEDLRDMYSEIENRIKMVQPINTNNNVGEVPFSSTYYRALLLKERSITESLLLIPLLDNGSNTNDNIVTEKSSSMSNKSLMSIIRSWDKCLKAHNPPHPDLYLHYIHNYINKIIVFDCNGTTPTSIVSHIRHIRYLYEKAIINVGNPNITHKKNSNTNKKGQDVVIIIPQSNIIPYRDYDISLSNLCYEWIEFEQSFGSDRSLFYANKIIQKKIEKKFSKATIPAATDTTIKKNIKEVTIESNMNESIVQSNELVDAVSDNDSMLSKKRSIENSTIFPTMSNKKHKSNHHHEMSQVEGDSSIVNDSSVIVLELTNPDEQPFVNNNNDNNKTSIVNSTDETIKVKVGNLEYPAHPYTVRVSSLHPDAEDMDLVDVFKNICGPIVHARLIRDKDNHSKQKHPRHKGWGLVQFEDRDSVLKALELNDVISIREKLITIERSHMPAVSLIPPGMHRISPVGEGKVSKRNLKARTKIDVKIPDPQHHPIIVQIGSGGNSTLDLSDDRDRTLEPASAASQFETKKASFVLTPSTNILAFRPRGVRNLNQKKQKVSLDLGTATKPEA